MHWNIKEIEVTELGRWLEQKAGQFRLIDVRQMGEIIGGTVPGAEPLPLHLLPMKVQELERDQTLVFLCRSGARSAQACAFLQQHGFENVYNVRGGMMAWTQYGMPSAVPAVA